jgi:hypothetical protein
MPKMKFRGHETFFIRKGWLSKGMRAVNSDPHIFMGENGKNPMDELGLGSNMVKSLRYWMQATGLASEPKSGKRFQTLTDDFGGIVFEQDPYLEETGTLWAIHCNLACNQELATSWYFFFNEFNMRRFTKDDFIRALDRYVKMHDSKSYSLRSFGDDFDCILSTYISRDKIQGKPISPESNIDCPLGELGIIGPDSYRGGRAKKDKVFKKRPATPSSIDPYIFEYALRKSMLDSHDARREVGLHELLNGKCYPGRLFNLDSVALLDKLYELEDLGTAKIIRTAGLDVVRIADVDRSAKDCLLDYYRSLK